LAFGDTPTRIPIFAAKNATENGVHARSKKKKLQITSARYNAKDEYFVLVNAVEDEMFGEP
jgi:hypothetical protein